MRILVIGSGGREHTLVWKIKQSQKVKEIFCAPGNGGTASIAANIEIKADDIESLLKFAKENKIDLTVVGPEAPLVAGIVDAFEKEGLKIFGPKKEAALLEGSKVFAKEFMYEWDIPTADFMIFDNALSAKAFLKKVDYPLVVKADGLAAGKGVIICKDEAEAKSAIKEIMEDKVFKEAGSKIVIEECLEGEEVSVLAICDGKNFCILDSAQDHKRIFDEDLGPNTGGMGAYSPSPITSEDFLAEVGEDIIGPVLEGMYNKGVPFKGVLYAGLMVTEDGPMVLEFNARFGDPETQSILPRMKSDIVDVLLASCEGTLDKIDIIWDKRCCVCVVMSSGGYPGKFKKGYVIKGLEDAKKDKNIIVFHAGTKLQGNEIITDGGRVLGVTGYGISIQDAINKTYKAVEKIKYDHCFFRRDIAVKALGYDKKSKIDSVL